MKGSLYLNYTTRSLLRGGQRTVLAVFCVAVGVMAIVALQLVGQMISDAFVSNVRDANGGDIAVSTFSSPLNANDLSFFDSLKKDGTITNYTPIISVSGSTGLSASLRQTFTVLVVDPQSYPVVTPPHFVAPEQAVLSDLLKSNQVVVDQSFADQYKKRVGDTLDVHATLANQGAVTFHVKIAGIAANSGIFAQRSGVVLISQQEYRAVASKVVPLYSTIDVATVDQAHTDRANQAIQDRFPLVNTQTASEALKANQQLVDIINKFLEIAGLLALLIGGVGIVNTMQVLLSRRKVEIAMLKTVGYRRVDLYLLFGLEAGLLGLVGGLVGAAASIGVSYGVLYLVQRLLPISIPFHLDPVIIVGGILIGLCTALIFGLMPIVQSANVRPLSVIRDLPEANRAGSIALTVLLLAVLSALFCLMAVVILKDVSLGIGVVYGTFVSVILLSLLFGLVVLLISMLPVPERFNIRYLALVGGCTLLSALLFLALPAFGALLLIASLMGFVVVLLPRTWKATTKMALRNIGRQRARTTTTMLALFVGVFTIGLILVLGQDLRDLINNTIAQNQTFNVVTITRGADSSTLRKQLGTLPGVTANHTQEHTYTNVIPLKINDQPLAELLPKKEAQPGFTSLGRTVTVIYLSSLEGYDLAHNQLPDTKSVVIRQGRNLQVSDAGTDNVLINAALVQLAPLKGHLKIGDTLSLASQDGKTVKTVHIIGTYAASSSGSNLGTILSPANLVTAFSPAGEGVSVFYMKIDVDKVGKAVDTIGRITPDASVFNFANLGDLIDRFIGNILLVLTAMASLSLLAGTIIIANAVALAMLERRRELGILKSVGYTSRTILSEVLIENGLIGGTGALLAMLLVTFATSLLGRLVFKTDFGVSWYIAIGLILSIALLAMIMATLVAWGSVRVRPLEVLRYE